jgi:hypothetical protein
MLTADHIALERLPDALEALQGSVCQFQWVIKGRGRFPRLGVPDQSGSALAFSSVVGSV